MITKNIINAVREIKELGIDSLSVPFKGAVKICKSRLWVISPYYTYCSFIGDSPDMSEFISIEVLYEFALLCEDYQIVYSYKNGKLEFFDSRSLLDVPCVKSAIDPYLYRSFRMVDSILEREGNLLVFENDGNSKGRKVKESVLKVRKDNWETVNKRIGEGRGNLLFVNGFEDFQKVKLMYPHNSGFEFVAQHLFN